jgi:hypothetical protein
MFRTAVNATPATTAFVRGEVYNWAKEPFVRAAYTYTRVRCGCGSKAWTVRAHLNVLQEATSRGGVSLGQGALRIRTPTPEE